MMPKVAPVHVKLAMIIHMDQLMRERMFHVLFAPKVSLAQYHCTQLGGEASRAALITRQADDSLRRVDVNASLLLDTLKHKHHSGA